MSKYRPECGTSSSRAIPNDTALFLIRDAVARRGSLIHGQLYAGNKHCALGAFWIDNPNATLNTELVDEVAAVNDSVPLGTQKARWKKVNEWLRWKVKHIND